MKYAELVDMFHPTDLELLAQSDSMAFNSAREVADAKAKTHVIRWLQHVLVNIEHFDVQECNVPECLPEELSASQPWIERGYLAVFFKKAQRS